MCYPAVYDADIVAMDVGTYSYRLPSKNEATLERERGSCVQKQVHTQQTITIQTRKRSVGIELGKGGPRINRVGRSKPALLSLQREEV